jgi:hypothetical protein
MASWKFAVVTSLMDCLYVGSMDANTHLFYFVISKNDVVQELCSADVRRHSCRAERGRAGGINAFLTLRLR